MTPRSRLALASPSPTLPACAPLSLPQDALSARQGRQGKGEEAQKHHEKLKANLAALGLESEEVSDILTSATLLRGLIRMKIADKNDIGTARFALAEMLHFFTTLRARAEAQNVEDWDVFCQLQH